MMNPEMPNHESRHRSRLTRWAGRIAVAGALLVAVLFAVHWLVPTPEERLAAFDAARAVADEDNAALIYAQLLQGQEVPSDTLAAALAPLLATTIDPMSLQESNALMRSLQELEFSEGITDPNAAKAIGRRPWKSADCPELKQWLDKRRNRIDRLQEAARKPWCYFPVGPTAGRMTLFDVPLGAFRQNAFLLISAANNDFGEGDIDGGLMKCQTVMLMGRHLYRQPSALCLLSGISCEATAIHRLAESIVEGPTTDRHLHDLTLCCDTLDDEWESLRRDIDRVRDVYPHLLKDQRPFTVRAYTWFQRVCLTDRSWNTGRTCELYHRMLCERRGLRIFIELRRFKNQTGQWPKSLDEIASSLPPQALIDPRNGGLYIYRLSGSGFSLHSTGPNRIDEKGRHKDDGPDDWPIWPPRGRGPEVKQKDANGV